MLNLQKQPHVKNAIGAATAVALVGGGYAAHRIYIDSDGGGSVYGYVQKYDDLHRSGTRVIVRGDCYSSCTMALGYPNACLMPDATLGFHPAYTPYLFGLLGYRVHQPGTQTMRDHYPADALDVIDRHNGLRDNGGWMRPQITVIPAKEFPRRYQCDPT